MFISAPTLQGSDAPVSLSHSHHQHFPILILKQLRPTVFLSQTGPHEYDLVLCPDVNSSRHQQWFYFEVSNTRTDRTYTFNVINNEKLRCQYQTGRSARRWMTS